MGTPRTAIAVAALGAALLLPAAPALAENVTTLADSGPGSLRAAIAAGGTVTFEPGLQGTIVLAQELTIDQDVSIEGPGADAIAISGGDTTRVLRIASGADATIEGVTIRDGMADGDAPVGAGLLSFNGGSIRLERAAVLDNEARKTTDVVPFGAGLAVYSGELTIVDSTIAGNVVTAEGGGGGVFIASPATFTITGSTISGNRAYGGAGLLSGLATGSIAGSTIARNEAAHVGGGIAAFAPGITLQRSLVTANTAVGGGPACDGQLATAGGNVVDSLGGCGLVAGATDTVAAAPVGVLGDQGGPTPTILPLPGNPAIDALGTCSGADQRGVTRPQGTGCDTGAVELRSGLASSGPLALGTARVGQQTAAASTTITNSGERDESITAVGLSGANAGEVVPVAGADVCVATTVLAPGGTCVLRARLAPASAGAKQATFTVSIAGSAVDVPVTGIGEAVPDPPVSGTGPPVPAPPGGGTTTTPSSADAVLISTKATPGKGGKLKLRLRCTTVGAARCDGSVTLKLGTRKLTRAYSILAGKQASVTLKLKRGDIRRLARKRALRSAVTVITAQPDGSRRTTHAGNVKLTARKAVVGRR